MRCEQGLPDRIEREIQRAMNGTVGMSVLGAGSCTDPVHNAQRSMSKRRRKKKKKKKKNPRVRSALEPGAGAAEGFPWNGIWISISRRKRELCRD
jgi:hypothetical protein